MKHPKRAITRDIRMRSPKGPARARRELEESSWSEAHLDRVLRSQTVKDAMTWAAISAKPDTLLR